MHFGKAGWPLLLSGILATGGFYIPWAACPAWVKKDQVTTGSLANAPTGWYIYSRSDMNGLFKSTLKSFSQQQIPNTQNDKPICVEMTYDGQWIVYLNTNDVTIYVIKNDGTQKTEVPVTGVDNNYPRSTGFYVNSSNQLEIIYLATSLVVRSVAVNLTSGTPQFGATRDLADLSNGENGLIFEVETWNTTIHACRNHLIAQGLDTYGPKPQRYYPLFITIPNNGAGTATASDIWMFNDLPDTSIYGCGMTLTADGSKLLYNPGSQGDPACIPNRESHLDHKGFVIVPFYETSAPQMGRDELIMSHGISANFCPVDYRFGIHTDVDFTEWMLTRNSRFVVGLLQGDMVDEPGAWLVDWQSNTWTQLTSGWVPVRDVAAFVQDSVSGVAWRMRPDRGNAELRPAGEVYTMQGRKVTSSAAGRDRNDHSLLSGIYIRRQNNNSRYFIIQ
jgi:hypothetical protein